MLTINRRLVSDNPQISVWRLWDDFPSWVLPTRQLPVSRHGVPAADVATCDQSDVVSEDM